MHNYTAWRDAFDPHLTRPAGGACGERPPRRAVLARDRRGRHVVVYGHYGPPVLAFPAEGGSAWDYESHGMVGAVARPARRRPGEALLRRLLRRRVVVERSLPLEERARAHGRYESWILDQVVPWIHADCGGAQDIAHRSASASAPSTRSTSRSSAPTCSRSRSACPATTTRRAGTPGASAARRLLQQPVDYVAHLDGDHLDWLRGG